MTIQLEDIPAGTAGHLVQFYADDAHLAHTVGGYLTRAMQGGAVAIAIATETHRRLFLAELESAGVDPAEDGTLVLLDAADTLNAFLDGDRIERDGFNRVVGSVMRDAAASGRAVHAYGEMVALLWEAGNVAAAIELEDAWNELAKKMPFVLLCAYRSESVVGEDHAAALHEVCRMHTSVIGYPAEEHPEPQAQKFAADFAAERQAAASARRFVAEVLQQQGHTPTLLEDAKLVISELATNAVLHARTPFTVEISRLTDRVRLSVHDRSRVRPVACRQDGLAPGGRGLRIVDALAADWGSEVAADGKTVWAEIRH